MVLRLTSCSPRRSGLLSPSSALLLADLTPASGRQNDTTSPSASAPFVTCAARVHRIPPRVRDVRNAPLWDRTVRISELIWVRCEGNYFCKGRGDATDANTPTSPSTGERRIRAQVKARRIGGAQRYPSRRRVTMLACPHDRLSSQLHCRMRLVPRTAVGRSAR